MRKKSKHQKKPKRSKWQGETGPSNQQQEQNNPSNQQQPSPQNPPPGSQDIQPNQSTEPTPDDAVHENGPANPPA
ncbi:MAG: hypothetical protein M1821_008617 [Bathelium mastoideum]|nr:MAG: hypothetical protein M1821_008617 [Bathelium mastoideum]